MTTTATPWLAVVGIGEDGLAGLAPAARALVEDAELLVGGQLIRIRYPRDRFFIVGFYTRARELSIREVPELTWNMSDPFTNLHDGLRVAQHLIDRNPSENQQIIVITDGQPTAYFVDNELRVEWPNGRGGISPRAVAATLREVRRVSRKGITTVAHVRHRRRQTGDAATPA